MKRITLTITVIGIFFVLIAPVLADGGRNVNVVQVNQRYYGGGHGGYHSGYHGGYHGGYQGGYYGGWNGYRAYYPPVITYRQDTRLFPNHPEMIPNPVGPYYYYPQSSFYYSSPGFSIGVGY
jgi:hypothetical protein